jgi:hypothetical protein
MNNPPSNMDTTSANRQPVCTSHGGNAHLIFILRIYILELLDWKMFVLSELFNFPEPTDWSEKLLSMNKGPGN